MGDDLLKCDSRHLSTKLPVVPRGLMSMGFVDESGDASEKVVKPLALQCSGVHIQ